MTSQFLYKFCIIFIAMKHNSSVNFKLIHFLLWIKGSHQSPNSETFECSGKNCQIPHDIFQTASQFFINFCITLQCHETQLFCNFLAQALNTLFKRSPLKCKFLRLLSTQSKIRQIPHVILKRRVNSSSNLASFFIFRTTPSFETLNCSGYSCSKMSFRA